MLKWSRRPMAISVAGLSQPGYWHWPSILVIIAIRILFMMRDISTWGLGGEEIGEEKVDFGLGVIWTRV